MQPTVKMEKTIFGGQDMVQEAGSNNNGKGEMNRHSGEDGSQ